MPAVARPPARHARGCEAACAACPHTNVLAGEPTSVNEALGAAECLLSGHAAPAAYAVDGRRNLYDVPHMKLRLAYGCRKRSRAVGCSPLTFQRWTRASNLPADLWLDSLWRFRLGYGRATQCTPVALPEAPHLQNGYGCRKRSRAVGLCPAGWILMSQA